MGLGTVTNTQAPGSDIDVNSTVCCDNSEYCIVDEATLDTVCCPLGSECGSKCPQAYYFSLVTTATSISISSTTTETLAACVARKCTSTFYLCPESFGGGCCLFGSDCASGGSCLSSTAAPSMAVCGNDQFSCGMSDAQGNRCCSTGAACTSVSSSGYFCATSFTAPAALPTTVSILVAPTATVAGTSNASDDIALKVGLGVGIPVGVITIAVLVFAWHIRRTKNQWTETSVVDQKADYRKPELAADPAVIPAELETGAPELPAQILEAELPEDGIAAELPGGAASETSPHLAEPQNLQERCGQ